MKNRLVGPMSPVKRKYKDVENVSIASPYIPTMLLVGNVSIRYNAAATLRVFAWKIVWSSPNVNVETIGGTRGSTLRVYA